MSIFSNIPKARIQRASFDLSHDRKLSMNLGQLTPIYLQEVVPGDKFNIQTQSMVRFSPLIAPIMHRMNSSIHYFFVPNRLVMEDWEDFITGQDGIMIPTVDLKSQIPVGSLGDHMGLPTLLDDVFGDQSEEVSVLPFRAYYQVWNDYYRDANLQEEIDIFDPQNNMNFARNQPMFRPWEKDYFTSALPTPQRGVPVNMDATVNYKTTGTSIFVDTGSNLGTNLNIQVGDQIPNSYNRTKVKAAGQPGNLTFENIDSVNIEVEELRRATKLQRFLERSMRAGNRYTEHLRAYWNVTPQDARLNRAEYLGGGKTPVVISDVANTSDTSNAPQGNLSGNALSVGTSNRASCDVQEHGYIIGIMSVIPEAAYSQGLHKHWSRKLQLDFYFPDFAQLGEQPILNKELFFSNDEKDNDRTFGYQSRYAEYKYNQSTVHGKFKTDLEFWHMARKFREMPQLNAEFITVRKIDVSEADPWRIFAVTDADSEQLWIQLHHNIKATRPMPFLNEPSIL